MDLTKEEFLQTIHRLADVLWKGDFKDLSDEELALLVKADTSEFCLALHNLKQVPVWARLEKLYRFEVNRLETLSTEELLEQLGIPGGDYMVEILVILRERNEREAAEGGMGGA